MKCDKCNVDLDENDVCPQCGCHYIFASEDIRFWDGYKLQKKNKEKYHSSNHRFYEEESLSYEISRDLGELVQRFKKEDRLNNQYQETVTRLNGEVIHSCNESLTDHINHGSAKKKEKE